MDILMEHYKAVVLPEELEQALADGYKDLYIRLPNGKFLRHQVLRGEDRYIRTEVLTVPGYTPPPSPSNPEGLVPCVKFLPAGLVPGELFYSILAFFRGVIKVHGDNGTQPLEAMIHVLWNAEQGYHLVPPTQKVGPASASYAWDHIPPGSEVVVDVHSHGSMSAFFSGTDNTDDSSAVRYSGVIGKVMTAFPEVKFRWCYKGAFKEVTLSEVFDMDMGAQVDPAWYEKVSVVKYTAPAPVGKHYVPPPTGGGYGAGRRTSYDDMYGDELGFEFRPGGAETSDPFPGTPVGNREGPALQAQRRREAALALQKQNPNNVHNLGGGTGSSAGVNTTDPMVTKSWNSDAEIPNSVVQETSNILSTAASRIGERVPERVSVSQTALKDDPSLGKTFAAPDTKQGSTEASETGAAYVTEEDEMQGMELLYFHDSQMYQDLCIEHGEDIAYAYMLIDHGMGVIHGQDFLLRSAITEMFELTGYEKRLSLFRELYHSLSPEQQSELQTSGL